MSGDGSGVVDTDLRFEGLDNLYVADNSVVPFIAAANPALTLSALSLRLAGQLHEAL
jgi:choline dehydrogenase-like flavoprotein